MKLEHEVCALKYGKKFWRFINWIIDQSNQLTVISLLAAMVY